QIPAKSQCPRGFRVHQSRYDAPMNALPDLDHPDLPPALRAQLLGWMEAAQQEARTRHEQLQLAQQTAVSLNETLQRTQQTLERRETELAARELAYQKV